MSSIQLHVAPIDDVGTVMTYIDSGAPTNSIHYTTVVVFHGSSFNAYSFIRLLPHLSDTKSNIRLVIVNRRGYAGSTPFTPAELALAADPAPGTEFLELTARNTAAFLAWYIRTHPIPVPHTGGGGLVPVGWSFGAISVLSLLAFPDSIPAASCMILEQYLQQIVLYDPPSNALGYTQDLNVGYNAFTDPACSSPAEMFLNFSTWISSYFDHDQSSHSDSSFSSSSSTGKFEQILANLDMGWKDDGRPSFATMSPHDLELHFEPSASAATDFLLIAPAMQRHLHTQTQRALFSPGRILRSVEVVYQHCTSSIWYCVSAHSETVARYAECIAKGLAVRPLRSVEIRGGNHFVHWDDPSAYLNALEEGLSSVSSPQLSDSTFLPA